MHKQHIIRILRFLDDPAFLSTFPVGQGASYRPYKGRAPWKWFFRDIGKQSCVVALLPFLEEAAHVKFMPRVDTFYPINKRDKAAFITDWAASPSTAKKREIISILTPANHHQQYDLFTGSSSPNENFTAFINWLILIIVIDHRFDTRVFAALDCLVRTGHDPGMIASSFQQQLRQHYEDKLLLAE